MLRLRITEQELTSTIREVIENVRQRQETYLPRAVPLTSVQKDAVHPFFPQQLLEEVKIVELKERLSNPPFQQRAQKRGYRMMFDFRHMAEITHPRLIIVQEKLTARLLFHALVHVVQYAVLGLERYIELYVRAFVQIESYAGVPIEVQAYQLDRRFTENPDVIFSVEAEVRDWADTGRFLVASEGQKRQAR